MNDQYNMISIYNVKKWFSPPARRTEGPPNIYDIRYSDNETKQEQKILLLAEYLQDDGEESAMHKISGAITSF